MTKRKLRDDAEETERPKGGNRHRKKRRDRDAEEDGNRRRGGEVEHKVRAEEA